MRSTFSFGFFVVYALAERTHVTLLSLTAISCPHWKTRSCSRSRAPALGFARKLFLIRPCRCKAFVATISTTTWRFSSCAGPRCQSETFVLSDALTPACSYSLLPSRSNVGVISQGNFPRFVLYSIGYLTFAVLLLALSRLPENHFAQLVMPNCPALHVAHAT
jgi:hypothetical protein